MPGDPVPASSASAGPVLGPDDQARRPVRVEPRSARRARPKAAVSIRTGRRAGSTALTVPLSARGAASGGARPIFEGLTVREPAKALSCGFSEPLLPISPERSSRRLPGDPVPASSASAGPVLGPDDQARRPVRVEPRSARRARPKAAVSIRTGRRAGSTALTVPLSARGAASGGARPIFEGLTVREPAKALSCGFSEPLLPISPERSSRRLPGDPAPNPVLAAAAGQSCGSAAQAKRHGRGKPPKAPEEQAQLAGRSLDPHGTDVGTAA